MLEINSLKMFQIKLKTYLNCGNAQARKRNRRPMEPLKARATKAATESYKYNYSAFEKQMRTNTNVTIFGLSKRRSEISSL